MRWLVPILCGCGGGAAGPMPGGAGESCAMPFALSGTNITQEGDTRSFSDDDGSALSSCGGSAAPDIVFTFTANTAAHVAVKITAGGGWTPVIKLRGANRGCQDLDEDCRSGPGSMAEISDWSPVLSGKQYLIVDGQSQTAGPFTLKVTVQ